MIVIVGFIVVLFVALVIRDIRAVRADSRKTKKFEAQGRVGGDYSE